MRRFALAALLFAVPAAPAADPPPVPKPAKTVATEPVARAYSAARAAEYLDGVAVNWTRDRKCVTCHTNMPYMLARPALGGEAWKEVREFLEADVAKWEAGGKPRGPGFVIATAFALAGHDAQAGKLHPKTRYALDRMWEFQNDDGGWKWLKCDWPPMEHDDYYGVTVAALAVGLAPEAYSGTEKAKAGLAKLKGYFAANPAPDLHHKVMLLWAATKIEGLLTPAEKAKTVADLRAKQRADGGWSLPSLGTYKRRDGAGNDPDAPSDGYASGLAVFVLRQAGVPADDVVVSKGAAWLRANQRESGRWFTRSVNNDKEHYISNAGTAFAVLALRACEGK